MLDRREMMKRAAMAALATGFGSVRALALDTVTLPFDNGERPLIKYPQKRPMIGLTSRPPQLETPFSIFNDGAITPNNAFFVRYHLAGVPLDIDPDKFTLTIKGKVDHPLTLSLKELRKLPAVELVAVNQCSGNSRGFSNPRVAGGQLGNGAMGNARWHGVRLKAVLDMAGVQQGARQVTFNGMDGPVSDTTPDFVKALDIDHARDGEVMLAYGMNGDDLPVLNGFPLRLAVPGYYGTYWVKHLNEITVIDSVFDGFWMKTAYRIPDTPCGCVEPGTAPKATIPINGLTIRSFITSVSDGAKLKPGSTTLKGVAVAGFVLGSANAAPVSYTLPDETAAFRPGPNLEVVQNNCTGCHSADYINTQPRGPKYKKDFWQAEVTKMIKLYGAPIDEVDIPKIVEYLAATY